MFGGSSPVFACVVNRKPAGRPGSGFPSVSYGKTVFAVSGGCVRILLSNDDGIHSPCLRALHDALCEAGHELDVVAPLTEQSGVGCSVTLHNPLRLYPVQEPGFSGTAVAGTPVDCVKLALTTLLPQPPDLVVVGINNGANKGVDVFLQRDRWRGDRSRPARAARRGLLASASRA